MCPPLPGTQRLLEFRGLFFFQGEAGPAGIPGPEGDQGLIVSKINTWVKVFRINPEFRILTLTFQRKSASKC